VAIRITNREMDVMAVLWARGSATVAEVLENLDADLAYTTVLTILRGLESKGYVRHAKEGKAHRYAATVDAEAAGDRPLMRVLDKVYQGSRELLIARLMADEDVTTDELKRIRRLLAERLKEVDE